LEDPPRGCPLHRTGFRNHAAGKEAPGQKLAQTLRKLGYTVTLTPVALDLLAEPPNLIFTGAVAPEYVTVIPNGGI
jgi:hypothetical protein